MKHSLAWVVGLLATVATGFGASIGGPSSGSSGGAATNAVATIAKDGSTIVSGALAIDFTNAASTVVTVSADGTTARVGIPQGGSGGGGGTNFPNVNLLVGNTNLAVVAGIEYAAYQVTNAAFTANIQQSGAFQSGQLVGLIVSNSSGSDFEVTINTNGVAANPYDIATKTNVNTFTASAAAITKVVLQYLGSGIWVLEEMKGPEGNLVAGTGVTITSGGVNGLDRTISASGGSSFSAFSVSNSLNYYHYLSELKPWAPSTTNVSWTSNTFVATPFLVTYPMTLRLIGLNAVNGVASTRARIGIYGSTSVSNFYPNALIVESGELNTSSSGDKTAAVDVALPVGTYWAAVLVNGDTTIPHIRALNTSFGQNNPLLGAANLGNAIRNVITVSNDYGALPSTFPAGAALGGSTVSTPAIGAKFQ